MTRAQRNKKKERQRRSRTSQSQDIRESANLLSEVFFNPEGLDYDGEVFEGHQAAAPPDMNNSKSESSNVNINAKLCNTNEMDQEELDFVQFMQGMRIEVTTETTITVETRTEADAGLGEGRVRTFINDVEVSAPNTTDGQQGLTGYFEASAPEAPSAPQSLAEKGKSDLWKAGSKVDRAVNKVGRKVQRAVEAKAPVQMDSEVEVDEFYYHNPPSQTPQQDSSPQGRLATITEAVYRKVTGRGKSQPALQPKGAHHSDVLSQDRREEIDNWNKHAAVDFLDFDFLACTTEMLLTSGGASLEGRRLVKTYLGPPASPAVEMCSLDVADIDDMELVDACEVHNPQTVHKDLIRLLGVRDSGIQVVSSREHVSLGAGQNLSDYYQMPLLESPELTLSLYKGEVGSELASGLDQDEEVRLEIERTNASINRNLASFSEMTTTVTDADSIDFFSDEEDDENPNVFSSPPQQPPSMALILYLHGKGTEPEDIADIIVSLDEKWVYSWKSAWFNGYRVPEHWEMSNKHVEQIKKRYEAVKPWWEEEFDTDGNIITAAFRSLQRRRRTRKALFFINDVIENYLWHRCCNGELRHKKVNPAGYKS